MAFIHMVQFKFAANVTDADKQGFIESLNALKTIEGVVRLHHGANVSPRSQFNYGLLVEFTTQEAERAYQVHPTHLVVMGWLKKVLATPDDLLASVEVSDYFDVANGENFTLSWSFASGVAAPLPLETVTIELHNHISFDDTRLLSVLGVVPANSLRFVWQLPEVVPIEWETKQLILKVYKSMATTVNNDPANRFWPFFTVVCATPVISITQPARVNCNEFVTVSWTYLFPEKNLWKPTDQLTLEIVSYLPLGIDPVLQKLTDSIPYGETSYRYHVPATIPSAWPSPDGKNRVYFVVSKTGDRQQTSDRVCLLCPYPYLTCVASTTGGPQGDLSTAVGGGSGNVVTDADGNTIDGTPGGGSNSIDPGLIAGVAIAAIIIVLAIAILAWYCLVHKRQTHSDRSVTIQNNLMDDAAFKTPMQSPMQTPRGGGMMGVADEERGQLNQMKSFPDGLQNQPSMQSLAFQQPTMHTRQPTYSGQAASTVATIPQQPHYGLAQHHQQQQPAQPQYGLSQQPQPGPNFYGPTQGMKPNF